MLSKIINQIKSIFTTQYRHEDLDSFIIRNDPTTVQDVEYLINLYDSRERAKHLNVNFNCR